MKRLAIIFLLAISTTFLHGQEPLVEKSIINVQTNLLGLWVNYEARVDDDISLRTEIGALTVITGGELWGDENLFNFVYVPVITIEPRFYYNLERRQAKSKNIAGNSGDFFSIKSTLFPGMVLFSNHDAEAIRQLSILPSWGIRRHFAGRFNIEFGLGLGFIINLDPESDASRAGAGGELNLRVGYSFY